MAKKSKTTQTKNDYPIGKSGVKLQEEKSQDFYQKHKSTFWTIIVLIILTFFFIVNNTRKIPEEGQYPPNYMNGSNSTN